METALTATICTLLFSVIVGCSSSTSKAGGATSEASPVGTWKVSPIPGRDATVASVTATWEVAFNGDMSYASTFTTVFAANASSFPGCTYSLTSSGGTWASVTVNGSTGLRLSSLPSHATARMQCTQASQNYATRPAMASESDPVVVTPGDYPYRISGSTLTITTGAGALGFTRE